MKQVDLICEYCDTPFRTYFAHYISGHTRSCGCLQRKKAAARFYKHGHYPHYKPSKTYLCWQNMWRRCTDPKSTAWKYYGGRGITVHPEWGVFENFLRDMGEKPENLTLDRINSNEGYELMNCRWATWTQQRLNQRRIL